MCRLCEGRTSMLVLMLLLMGSATTMIGLLPTYDQIGIWSPVLLVVLLWWSVKRTAELGRRTAAQVPAGR